MLKVIIYNVVKYTRPGRIFTKEERKEENSRGKAKRGKKGKQKKGERGMKQDKRNGNKTQLPPAKVNLICSTWTRGLHIIYF